MTLVRLFQIQYCISFSNFRNIYDDKDNYDDKDSVSSIDIDIIGPDLTKVMTSIKKEMVRDEKIDRNKTMDSWLEIIEIIMTGH